MSVAHHMHARTHPHGHPHAHANCTDALLMPPARYMNQTWGAAYGQADAHGFRSRRQLPSASSPPSSTSYLNGNSLSSTATSALGHLLTKGSLLGAGVHGSKPSGA